MMRWVIGIVLVAAVALIVLAMLGVFSSGVLVEAAQVTRGDIRQFVDEQGKTRLPQTYLVTMPFDGRIEPIALTEGHEVKADQVVAQLVQTDLDDEVAQAQAAVDRLEASIKENRDKTVENTSHKQSLSFVESMIATLKAAENRQTASKRRLDYADRNLSRVRGANDKGASTQDELERAELRYVEAEVEYKQDELVAASIGAVKAATDLLPLMVTQYMDRKDLTAAVLVKQRDEAQAKLNQVLTNQKRGKMHSPIAGVVLERLESNERRLGGGTVLLRIGDLSDLEIEADVLSQDVVAVLPRQAAEVYGPAVGAVAGSGVKATVERVYPAGFTKISSLGVEQQRVKVLLRFDPGVLEKLRQEKQLGVDYRVRVRIYTAESKNTLIVPRSAIFRGPDGNWQAFHVEEGRARKVPVEVGLLNDERVEIKSGLAEGDTVILAPESSLTEGAKVDKGLER